MTMPPSGQWPPPPQGPPQYWGPPATPSRNGKKAKWVLGGLGVLAVVVVTVVATLLVTRTGVDPATPTDTTPPVPSVVSSRVASANDRGPVAIITEDPTCAAWTPIGDTLVDRLPQGWKDRDASLPSSAWTSDVRAEYDAAASAMRAAAEQTVPLVSKTPHRVMREIYEQTIAYWRAYADATPTYEPADNYLAGASTAGSNALVWICGAISRGSAASRTLLIDPTSPPNKFAPLGSPAQPQRFLKEPSPACRDWQTTSTNFDAETAEWANSNPNIPVSQWPPQQQSLYAAISTTMSVNADTLQNLGIQSSNATFADFADLAALYRRAYVQSFPTYVPADAYLANSASQLVALVNQACLAAEN